RLRYYIVFLFQQTEPCPCTTVHLEKVHIYTVFPQVVIPAEVLKSVAISGKQTFKTISFNTLKNERIQPQNKTLKNKPLNFLYKLNNFTSLLEVTKVYRGKLFFHLI